MPLDPLDLDLDLRYEKKPFLEGPAKTRALEKKVIFCNWPRATRF